MMIRPPALPLFPILLCLCHLSHAEPKAAGTWQAPGEKDMAHFVWAEGEQPLRANFKWKVAGASKEGLLSEDKWLMPEERTKIADEGLVVEYGLRIPKTGTYDLWLRIGFEWIRPHVSWRLGEGKWTTVGIAKPTRFRKGGEKSLDSNTQFDLERRSTNVTEVGFWAEVAWWHVGTVDLKKGRERLTLKFIRTDIEDPLLALDVVALVQGKWTPEGRLRPGEAYGTETDLKASAQVYDLPLPQADAERTALRLTGLWQVARYDDPDMDAAPYTPVDQIPAPEEHDLRWMGVEIPSSLWGRKETCFAHRVIYRTRVNIPAEHEGRGFKLHFSGTNWIVSVFVDGKLAGSHRGVWVPWDLDVSDVITPGKVNEIAVAVKGPYYAIDLANTGEGALEQARNRPRSRLRWTRWIAPIDPSTKGDGNGVEYGIVNPVTLVSVGNAYTEDLFIKPSFVGKRLENEITIRNTRDAERKLSVVCEAVYDRDGRVEKTFGPVAATLPAKGTAAVTVAGPWEAPKLWWPEPNPHLYRLRTRILEGGEAVDVQEEFFGFREITVDGPSIRINGVRRNFWNWVDAPGPIWSTDEYLEATKASRNRFMRFSHGRKISKVLKTREERLEFYDRNGLPGRLCSMIDGMFISFVLGRGVRDPKTNQTHFEPNEPVWDGFRQHLDQLTRAYRNHPSVIMYQIENELVYINGMNLYGGFLDVIEAEMLKVYEAGYRNDPTRPYTVGGGGDLSTAKGATRSLEINSPHYPMGSLDWYPENAYTLEKFATKISRWPWTRKKAWVVGESAFANAIDFATCVDGGRAYRDMDAARGGKAKFLRMLYGGYRWAGVAGFFPWDILHEFEDSQKVFSDLCVIPRKQTHRLFSGKSNELLFKVMNDTLSAEAVTFEWSYEVGGKRIAGGKSDMAIEPGFGVEQTLTIQAPETDVRLEGTLTLKATQPGADDYTDLRVVPVLPGVDSLKTAAPISVFDRSGKLAAFLTSTGTKFRPLKDLGEAGSGKGLLLIGPDTLEPNEAFGQELLAFAASGGKVIVLEQEVPVAGQNLAAPMHTTTRFGGYAHPQALGTPVFRDLGPEDLIDWAGEHPTYKNVYVKPSQGARSLVECGAELPYSALVEMSAGEGVLVLCQLRVGAKLRLDPAAEVLLRNMVEHYAGYEPPKGVAAVYLPGDPFVPGKIQETGVLTATVDTLEGCLLPERYRAVIARADASTMAELKRLRTKADAFQEAGGWILLCGVTPETLAAFNELMGTAHLLRPFRIERVTLSESGSPLAATLGIGDVALVSPDHIMHDRYWLSGNTFSYVIDGHDAAPFTFPPGAAQDPYEYKPTKEDHDPYNFVNGCFSSDFWRYIRQIWIPEQGPEPLVFTLRQPEVLKRIKVWNNEFYWTIKDLDIIFDGNTAGAVRMVLSDSAAAAAVELGEPVKVQQTITLQIRTWRERKLQRPDLRLVGIDNVQFLRASPPSKAVFLDNVGGLVAFPKGKGGVFLNQVKFMANEPRKVNASKKLSLVGTILQNMGVGSRASTVAVPGFNIRYETIEITDYCNHYLSDRQGKTGWLGRKGQDLRKLQVGKQHLANVMYHVVDYATAPVADCIMLGASGAPKGLKQEVTGIKVGKKADALFFLHAASVTRPINDRERAQMTDSRRPFKLPEVARYVIHYADGQKAEVPVVLECDVAHWLQDEAIPLPGAAVAWSAPLEGLEGKVAVLYSMKVTNPRPDVEIGSIDVVLGRDEKGNPTNRAVPVLLAITVGSLLE